MKLIAQRPFRLGGQPIKPDQPVTMDQPFAKSLVGRGLAKPAPDEGGTPAQGSGAEKKEK